MRSSTRRCDLISARLALCAAATSLLLFDGSPAHAYLSLIRQGQEAPEVPNAGEFLGWSLTTGDFNGDGYDDVAAGAPSEDEDLPGGGEHGAVIVNYGSARGITHLSPQFLTVGAVPDGIVHFGIALAAGDFNGDTFDDLAVGLPDLDGNLYTIASSGEVHVFLGGPNGLSSSPDVALDQSWAGDPLEAGDEFGAALATGYFNGDAYADLAVGSPGENNDVGAVFVFYGQAIGSGISASGVQSFDHVDYGGTSFVQGRFGAALAAGDLFGTAEEELAIGAPLTPINALPGVGRVFLTAATAGGLTTVGSFYQDPVNLSYPWHEGGKFGSAIAIGHILDDINTYNQMAVGAPESMPCDGCDPSGVVYLVRDFTGPGYGFTYFYSQASLGEAGENEFGDRFGHALDAGDWDDDGWDDLAVGVPSEDYASEPVSGLSASGTGRVIVWLGGGAGLGPEDDLAFNAATMNDTLESGMNLGWAVAYGHFDDSGRANLAIGVPLKDFRNYRTGEMTSASGQVHILAPWRQPQGRPHRSSAVTDCNGDLVYAQRPFQAMTPASVTKAMTVLLAVEAFQNGDVDTNDVYTVPAWVADNVTGSQAGLVAGEQIAFGDLIKLAVSVSAGDACYGIGDVLTGGNHTWDGLDGTLVGFANMMNIRAMQIGMNASHFNNPSGRPLVDHYTTAYDWLLFAQTAMQNPLFRYYVGTTDWLGIPSYSPQPYQWMKNMQALFGKVDGIKPGRNPLSMGTALASADDFVQGRFEASVFGSPDNDYSVANTFSPGGTAAILLQLAFAECNPSYAPPPPGPEPDPSPWGEFPHIPTGPPPDPPVCFLVPIESTPGESVDVDVFPQDVPSPPADFELCVSRISELALGPGESATFTADPVRSHLGVRIYNVLRTAADLQIDVSDPASSTVINLPGDDEYLVPAAGPVGTPFSVTIQNLSTVAGAKLEVDEKGYKYQTSVSTRSFTFHLSCDHTLSEEVLKICIDGLDPSDSNVVSVSVHPAGVNVVAVEPPPVVASAPGVRVHAAVPNPFTSGTTLAYELEVQGPVWISVHDVSGRRVRTLEHGASRAPGRHVAEWDGRDDGGQRVPAGIYFHEVRTASGSASARVVRLR